jgi:hypothetical protein
MYKLPKDFDGSFLVGRTLEMVCFGANQVFLHLGDGTMITIESSFQHTRGPDDRDAKKSEMPIAVSDLMQLVGRSVVQAMGDKNGTLTLFFDNEHALKCFDDSSQYESYQIKHGGKIVIV